MKIAIGSDHAGFELKKKLIEHLASKKIEIIDLGSHSLEPVDYPDFTEKVAAAVVKGDADRGLAICGSGVGACIAANKIPGVRAGICHDTYSSHQGVEHDDMNILVMGSRIIGESLAKEILDSFLQARFSNDERHIRRLAKIAKIEEHYCSKP